MHTATLRFLALLLSFFSVGGHLSAVRAQAESSGKKKAPIMIRVLCSKPVEGSAELNLVQGETKLTALTLLPSMVSDPISVGQGELVLSRRNAKTKNLDPVLKLSIPESGRRFVLLLFPAEEHKEETPYRYILVSTDDVRFGVSALHLFNSTEVPISGNLGKSEFSLEPGKSEVVTPAPEASGDRMYQARFYHLQQSEKKLFSDGRWPLAAGSRVYLFFISDPARNSVAYLSFREYAPFK